MHILGTARNECHNSQEHGSSRYGKADGPADTLLDVHQAGDRQEGAQVDGKVEPVEEAILLLAIL